MDLAFVVIVAILCGAFGGPLAAAQSGGPFAARIACGATADSVEPETGFVWSKDTGYTGGSAAPLNVTSRIAPQLNTLRYFEISDGPENCYNITVPSGHYLTRFFFSYGEKDNQGREPFFEVSLEGTLVYTFSQGWSATIDNEYADSLLHVTDGAATVCFHNAGHGNPAIASLEILQLYVDAYNMGASSNLNVVMRTIKRVTAGAAQSGYGARMHADVWGGDRYWATDQTLFAPGSLLEVLRTIRNITNYGNPPNIYPEKIYQSATTTSPMNKLSYTIAVQPQSNYSIWLHFAEIEEGFTFPGMRVFDVLANGIPIFPDVDIVAMAGAPFKALILNTTVMAESNRLTITFQPKIGSVAVNAFEIFQIIPRQYATVNENVWALQGVKENLQLPSRLGWNGDPCVPPVHPWNGVTCTFDPAAGGWFVSAVNLGEQGVRGVLSDNWLALQQLQSLNLSNNLLVGAIPTSFGNMTSLATLDLSRNRLNGSIPSSLGQLPNIKQLLLNDNQLTGEVPAKVGALSIRGAIVNLANNPGLCGVGIGPCSKMSVGEKFGLYISLAIGLSCMAAGAFYCWKKKIAITRGAQRLPRDAPYAKARTTFVRDVQMARTTLSNHFSRPAPSYHEVAPLNPH
ncbi:hypothetical protein M758_4G126400 [Ceratodon purpureus]|uniref:Malectin-like domain-containing protein n=1 Tax=Ceratodon purpureus TaxID=3225 RepID=A0A8T0IBF4_CERPU|nr:hypothetical protein KC19_4G125200 [Ceratodon purpureus]KAG0619257.1 hypothetical protein M758_4G126400 [Ceratodon purpureus]